MTNRWVFILSFLVSAAIAAPSLIKQEPQVIKLKVPGNAEGNHFDMQITYIGSGSVSVSKAWLPLGKWVLGNYNYHDEIQSPEGKAIYNGQSMRVSSAGRENSPSGTEGSFDLVRNGMVRLVYVYWDACWQCDVELQVKTLDSSITERHSRWGNEYILSNMCVVEQGYDGSSCQVW